MGKSIAHCCVMCRIARVASLHIVSCSRRLLHYQSAARGAVRSVCVGSAGEVGQLAEDAEQISECTDYTTDTADSSTFCLFCVLCVHCHSDAPFHFLPLAREYEWTLALARRKGCALCVIVIAFGLHANIIYLLTHGHARETLKVRHAETIIIIIIVVGHFCLFSLDWTMCNRMRR